MKVLHVPYCFHPDPVGGTEVYTEALARRQLRNGIDAIVAAPGPTNQFYTHQGLNVYRFQTGSPSLRELYGAGDPAAAAHFAKLLASIEPDLVHLHAFTSGVSLEVARAVKQAGLPLVFSYHTPAVSCARGTLLRWGHEVCDGKVDANICARCSLHGKGVSRSLSWTIGSFPIQIGKIAGNLNLSGGLWTAIRTTELMSLRKDAFRSLLQEADQIIAVCEWVQELLVRNGADREKVTLSRQGLNDNTPVPKRDHVRSTGTLRVAFLGRLSSEKGIGLLVEAIRQAPELPVALHIFGIAQGIEGRRLLEHLMTQCASDSRIHFAAPIPAEDVVRTLQTYDLLAVPSQGLETGPLVVYEAFAAGIPVIGSNLGGIAELVRNGENGLLLRPDSPQEWTDALRRVIDKPELLAKLTAGVTPPRTMETAEQEVRDIYQRILRVALAAENHG